jgi:hypothetical protein
MLVEVTRHAEDRYRQRVRGTLDARSEIATRVSRAYDQGRVEAGPKHEVLVRDRELPGLIFVCRSEGGSLIVITLWEDDDTAARVPKRFTDALRPTDDHVA